ncbi:hypothetical protein [Microbacterium sp.]|uniref:hypothetical protein n=1 Tax=Microbacterium sp. TaxID=51671 RepID=UPI0039E2F2D0
MDPLWAALAEWWWIGPAAIGTGTLGVIGLRRLGGGRRARRLGYDAARHALRSSHTEAVAARNAVRIARAELTRAQAERAASRATPADVAAARRRLQTAQHDAKAATASTRVWRTRVTAERQSLPRGGDPSALPLARMLAIHDAVTARWLEYETDPAKLIAFPTMSDARVPTVAAYLTAYREAQRLRPASATERISPARFAQYRESVSRLETAFVAAEQEAWRQARATGSVAPDPADRSGAPWTTVAQTIVSRSAAAIARATESTAARYGAAAEHSAPAGRGAAAGRSTSAGSDSTSNRRAPTRMESSTRAPSRNPEPTSAEAAASAGHGDAVHGPAASALGAAPGPDAAPDPDARAGPTPTASPTPTAGPTPSTEPWPVPARTDRRGRP